MPTYGCFSNPNGSQGICPKINGHYIANIDTNSSGVPYFNTSSGVIAYSAYFDSTDDNVQNTSKNSYHFIACISGQNISSQPSCSLIHPVTKYWTVHPCTANSQIISTGAACDTALDHLLVVK